MSDRFYAEIDFPAYAVGDEDVNKEIASLKSLCDCNYAELGSNATIATVSYANAPDGEFPDLEVLLVEKGIPFNRQSSAYYEYPAERRIYRPAAGDEPEVDVTVQTTDDGCRYVETAELRSLLELSAEKCLEELRRLLDERDPRVISIQDWIARYGPRNAA